MGTRSDPGRARAGSDIRVAFVLPGLHKVMRGAEVAFESIAQELGTIPGFQVTLIGSGRDRPGRNYAFIHSPCTPRERFERWPAFPPFRSEYVWEEATFVARLGRRYDPGAFDATITCSYPFINWALRWRKRAGRRPRHIFVTQNGDWPAQAKNREYRWFGCDGLVCTNPIYFERNKSRYLARLIPNGVDASRSSDTAADRAAFGLDPSRPVVVIVAALIQSKRVLEGIRAVGPMADVQLLVVGDGPLRDEVDAAGRSLVGQRYRRITVPFEQMPTLYASADVLLHMSKDEPFGNIYVEALAAGLPVVAHDWVSTRWLFEDQGLLVDTDDPESVRNALRRAFGLKTAAQVAARRDLVRRRFTWKVIAEDYAACLRTLLT